MSFIGKVKQMLSTITETTEMHSNEQLRSRYYKTNKQQAMKVVEELLRHTDGCELTFISSEHGEISATILSPKKASLVATIVTVQPYVTAIDFMVSMESSFSLFGQSQRYIIELYERLDKQLTCIGTGLASQL